MVGSRGGVVLARLLPHFAISAGRNWQWMGAGAGSALWLLTVVRGMLLNPAKAWFDERWPDHPSDIDLPDVAKAPPLRD